MSGKTDPGGPRGWARPGGSAQRSRAERGGQGRTAGPRPLLPRSRAERSAGAGDAGTGLWSSDGGQAEEARGRGVPYNPPRVWDLRAGRVCWDGAGLQGLTRYRDPGRKRGGPARAQGPTERGSAAWRAVNSGPGALFLTLGPADRPVREDGESRQGAGGGGSIPPAPPRPCDAPQALTA